MFLLVVGEQPLPSSHCRNYARGLYSAVSGPSLIFMGQIHAAFWGLALVFGSPGLLLSAAKPHVVVLGPVKKVPYSIAGDPAGAGQDEKELRVRPTDR